MAKNTENPTEGKEDPLTLTDHAEIMEDAPTARAQDSINTIKLRKEQMTCREVDKLNTKFPKLFQLPCEISCGEGWYPIIHNLCQLIEDEIHMHNLQDCYPTQIKEKYGTLRFYMSTETDRISNLINIAEDKSAKTCELCGNPGTLHTAGWYKTLCKDCYV